ncbi:hypothetical protein QCA50_020408 [Cerrena zonata]|uniref:Uncharacterized protein n=1 Tax=Cerrena zonata TaxID=2478898 RepID=A0AAW0FBV7_9APHY
MCWSMIENKLDQHEYWDLEDFKRDIKQVVRNAMTYNKPGTAYYKTAQNINNKVDGIFADLDKYVQEHSEISSTLSKDSLLALFPPLCNLEPPLPLLELLAKEHPMNEEMELVLSAPPLESLFTFEFPVFKPPPVNEPEPQHAPSKSKKTKSKSKKQKDKDLDSSPGFRAPARNRPSATQLPNEDGAVAGPSTIPETQVSVSEPVGEEDVPEDPAVTKTSKKPRRPPLAQPGQEPPHVVEDVDKQDLFKMFNQGWVLSAGHKRGGRVPVERGPVPPPKKRQRVVEREKSHLSTLSTSIAENDTLRTRSRSPGAEGSMRLSPLPISEHQSSPQPAVEEPKPDPGPEPEAEPTSEPVLVKSQEEETVMSIDDHHQEHPEVESSNSSSSLSQPSTGSQAVSEHPNEPALEDTTTVDDHPPEETAEVSQPQNMAEEEEEEEEEDTGPPRIIIIEELDTPATRREKNIRKKAERERAKAAARATEFAQAQLRADPEPIAGPSHSSQPSWDADSELSSLSGLSDEEEEPSQELRAKIDPQPSTSPAVINLGPGEKLQEGTLVWAKCKGNPWWPAVVFDRDSDEVDPELLEHPLSKADQHHLVRFFDSKRSWDWLPPDKLLLLHEDKALDEDMLAAKSKRQTWKVYKKRAQVRQGYKEAIAEMETSS